MVFCCFFSRKSMEVFFAPVHMLINIVRNLTCWHAYILNERHYFHVLLFSRVVIFAFFLAAKITTARKLMSLRYTSCKCQNLENDLRSSPLKTKLHVSPNRPYCKLLLKGPIDKMIIYSIHFYEKNPLGF